MEDRREVVGYNSAGTATAEAATSGMRLTPISVQLFCDSSGFDSVRDP